MLQKESRDFMRKVNKRISIPLYLQLGEIIREMIDDGDLKEGGSLMPERDIASFQEISRMTVNKAIAKLVDEGYLIRQQGKGTTVAKKRPISRYESLEGLSEMKKKSDMEVSSRLISFEEMELSKWIKRKLKTDAEWGYKIKRVRYLNGEPLVRESIYLSKEMCPDLTMELVETNSMYDLYTKYFHHELSQAEQIIRPIQLKEDQAEQLEQEKGDLALQIKRHLYTKNKKVMEYTESIFLSQKYDFQIVLK
jgi:GntR family transcriptional regulator